MKTVFAALLVLCGCAKERDTYIEQEVVQIVVEFEQIFEVPVNVDIYYSNELPDHIAGYCNLVTKQIFLNHGYWKKLQPSGRTSLIWHEVGHCVAGIQHDPAVDEYGLPESVMYYAAPSSNIFSAKYETYKADMKEKLLRARGAK